MHTQLVQSNISIVTQVLTAEEVGVVEVVVQQVQLLALVKQRSLGDELVVGAPEVASEAWQYTRYSIR